MSANNLRGLNAAAGHALGIAQEAYARTGGASGQSFTFRVGDYTLFQDDDGGLKIRDPNGTIVLTLVSKT